MAVSRGQFGKVPSIPLREALTGHDCFEAVIPRDPVLTVVLDCRWRRVAPALVLLCSLV